MLLRGGGSALPDGSSKGYVVSPLGKKRVGPIRRSLDSTVRPPSLTGHAGPGERPSPTTARPPPQRMGGPIPSLGSGSFGPSVRRRSGWAAFFAAEDPTPPIASPLSAPCAGGGRAIGGSEHRCHGRSGFCLGRVRGAGGHDFPGACPVAEPVLASSGPVDLEPANHCSPSRGPFLSTFWRPRGYASRAWTRLAGSDSDCP